MIQTFSHPTFSWDEKTGSTLCIIAHGDKNYCGYAQCAEEDMDMKSKMVGCEIAYCRAVIRFLQAEKERIHLQKQALEHLYSTFPDTDILTNSKATQRLKKEIKNLQLDFCDAQKSINSMKQYLREYIIAKDNLHNKIRESRKAKSD